MTDHIDPGLQLAFNNFINSMGGGQYTTDQLKDIIHEYGIGIDAYIEKYKRDNWNASRTDIALAWVGESKDSLIANAQFSSFSIWATQALRVHRGGQLLLGGHVSLPRSENKDSTKLDITGNLRYYLGTKDFRGFIEAQYKYQRAVIYDKSLLFNLGTELRVAGSWWVVASAGINNYLKEAAPLSKIVSSIDVRYGFNNSR